MFLVLLIATKNHWYALSSFSNQTVDFVLSLLGIYLNFIERYAMLNFSKNLLNFRIVKAFTRAGLILFLRHIVLR